MKVKVDQCCCGCTLKTGTILIAAYYIVSSSAVFSMCILRMSMVKHGTNNSTGPVIDSKITENKGKINKDEDTLTEYAAARLNTMFSIYAIFFAFSILINVMLLVGAHKENLRLIYIWIVAQLIYLIMSMIGLISNMFLSLMNSSEKVGSIGSTLLNIVLTFYFLVVVFSYHEQIKDRQQGVPHRQQGVPPSGPPVVVYIDHQTPPPPYAELYPPWPQQGQFPPK
ncbi:hypothetical protein L9F63_019973 [Diploptera punctata]|uniref:Uncharacterized protein n=1 Tax=Diploptera punctata TaxID=6984 RepID=A0AAD8EE43_DIPPU|nr:hypothetical protein L9F63_019973 [Diploptera punctata]